MDYYRQFEACNCCVVIPTYNNEKTLATVINGVLEYTDRVIVVNDGSTDSTAEILNSFGTRIDLISRAENLGKGSALRIAFRYALKKGNDYAITIDSDGQHFASDLPVLLAETETNPDTLVIGARDMTHSSIPGKSSFGHKFSNFWCRVETGEKLDDTQSGYRLYPIRKMEGTKTFTNRFEYEVEIVVKSSWRGIPLKNVPVKIYYEQGSERVTHFRPFQDFARISFLNTYLVILAVIYYIPRRFIKSINRRSINEFLETQFFDSNESTLRKSSSIGFGVFMGIFPVWGYQMLIGIAVAHLLKLNKAIFLVAANISLPPLIPFIIYGSYKVGALLVENPKDDLFFSSGLTFEIVKSNLFQYLVGAVTLALISGILAFGISYLIILAYRSRSIKNKERQNSPQ